METTHARAGREPGYFGQVASLFGGELGWVNTLLMGVQTILFLAGAWCAWEFFQTTDTLLALRWGLSAGVLLIVAAILKVATLWPSLQANRVLRELKRLEARLPLTGGGKAETTR